MEFEWDEAKSEKNFKDRGFDFALAALIFDGPIIEAQDSRQPYGETRINAIGEAGGRLLYVTYTDRGNVRRIISARVANKKERTRWQTFEGR